MRRWMWWQYFIFGIAIGVAFAIIVEALMKSVTK